MRRRSLTYYAMPILMLAVVACGGKTNVAQTAPQIEQYGIVRIAVLPFSVERLPRSVKSEDMPLRRRRRRLASNSVTSSIAN